MGKRVLLTGGAGFIGSNILKALLDHKEIAFVRVLDNLSTGKRSNLEEYLDHENFEYTPRCTDTYSS